MTQNFTDDDVYIEGETIFDGNGLNTVPTGYNEPDICNLNLRTRNPKPATPTSNPTTHNS
ncbi:hypothetical protein [Chryseobacterium sp. JV558]|uniref:hypothetical protein n=1 Tax=Chryseobacterium sp. JV558 TaxID=2663236 RepID=UPI00299DAD69|nr:hypothetical protein [Chryseobacterium sp. JV558]MDW9382856.1 hypothetical protein [Chryseobacterium sp. JV558]